MALLDRPTPTIPSHWYYDDDHYQLELREIWYQQWICVGREEQLGRSGDYLTADIGDQSVIVTRNDEGLHAFHNTCRHRGARLCTESKGRFRNGRIICKYHTWTYGLDGALLATPFRLDQGNFDASDYPLYKVHVDTWRGFIFVNLSETPSESLIEQLGDEPDYLANWPLEDLHIVHSLRKPIRANWKIYWENYTECYHCPRVHPALCKIMPVYAKGTVYGEDIDGWTREDDGDAETWSPDGKSFLPTIDGLSDDNLDDVVTFASFMGTMYIAAHRDYVRTVRLVPRGPEQVDLAVDWLLPASSVDTPKETLQPIFDFPLEVITEDGDMCELNQKGIRSLRHEHGALAEQEAEIVEFHDWLRDHLNS